MIVTYKKITLLLFVLTTLVACSSETKTPTTSISEETKNTNDGKAQTVFRSGNIYTVDNTNSWAEAIAIKDGEIVYVGSNDNITQYIGQQTQVYDLEGKMMMPGIHDVHMHPLEAGSSSVQFVLDTNEYDAENYIQAIKKAARENPNTEWLIGAGHHIQTLMEADRLPIEIIDDAVMDRPVIIMEESSHSMWVNSKALELAGLSEFSEDPTGGIIDRTKTGELSGILFDNAGNIVMEQAMLSLPDNSQNDYAGLVEYTLPQLNKVGITSLSDARSYWKRGHVETWQKVAENNELTIRVSLGLWAYPEENDETQIDKLKSLYQVPEDSFLKIDQVKFYMDGLLRNTTAAMHQPYNVNMLGLAENKGLNYFTQARLEKYLVALEPAGFDFNIHAIGDRGVTEALDAIQNASNGEGRHRLTHVEVVAQEDLSRFGKLNVIADAQMAYEFAPYSEGDSGSDPEYVHLIGEHRASNLIPIKSLIDNQARLTLSSDWDVGSNNPFIGIANVLSLGDKSISLTDAIRAYTINGAYAMRQDDLVGSIEVGKRADLIILDRDLFNATPKEISQTKVTMTVLDGEIIYQSQN